MDNVRTGYALRKSGSAADRISEPRFCCRTIRAGIAECQFASYAQHIPDVVQPTVRGIALHLHQPDVRDCRSEDSLAVRGELELRLATKAAGKHRAGSE